MSELTRTLHFFIFFMMGIFFLTLPAQGQQNNALPEPPLIPPGTSENDTLQMKDIHDIKPPVTPLIHPKWLYPIIAAVLILLLLGIGYWLWKKRNMNLKSKPEIILPPEEIALKSLDDLADVDQYDGKEFYFRLSEILRKYISGRYHIHASEMTTEELLPTLNDLEMDKELQQGIRQLCRNSDPIKFADVPSVQSQMLSDLAFVINVVKKTTPVQADLQPVEASSGENLQPKPEIDRK